MAGQKMSKGNQEEVSELLLVIYIYIAVFAFVIISLSKAMKYARMPMHSRWELYPVPKEKGRAEYGGSYYEESKWWEKPRQISLWSEIKDMLKEMLFIKNLFQNQRSLWWLSYGMHLGFYLLILWAVLLLVGAITEMTGLPIITETGVNTHWWPVLIHNLTVLAGGIGAILTAIGSAGLLLRRLSDKTMKKYTTLQEYFNLLFILLVVVTGISAWQFDPAFIYARTIMQHLLTFTPFETYGALTIHLVLLGLLLIYIPLTKMSHYVGKYFTYHKVLWENEPNLPGSEVEKKVREATVFKPQTTWCAPHFQSGDMKSLDQ